MDTSGTRITRIGQMYADSLDQSAKISLICVIRVLIPLAGATPDAESPNPIVTQTPLFIVHSLTCCTTWKQANHLTSAFLINSYKYPQL